MISPGELVDGWRLPEWIGDRPPGELDLSLNKRFAITERLQATFTGEFSQRVQSPDFAPPNRAIGHPALGTITDATDGGLYNWA